jgi:hypothetical protein
MSFVVKLRAAQFVIALSLIAAISQSHAASDDLNIADLEHAIQTRQCGGRYQKIDTTNLPDLRACESAGDNEEIVHCQDKKLRELKVVNDYNTFIEGCLGGKSPAKNAFAPHAPKPVSQSDLQSVLSHMRQVESARQRKRAEDENNVDNAVKRLQQAEANRQKKRDELLERDDLARRTVEDAARRAAMKQQLIDEGNYQTPAVPKIPVQTRCDHPDGYQACLSGSLPSSYSTRCEDVSLTGEACRLQCIAWYCRSEY